MVQTAAHRSDHVFPRLPMRQWVLSVPKRLRYFMQSDGALLGIVWRILLRVIELALQRHIPGGYSAVEQGGAARRRGDLNQPIRLQSERKCALPC